MFSVSLTALRHVRRPVAGSGAARRCRRRDADLVGAGQAAGGDRRTTEQIPQATQSSLTPSPLRAPTARRSTQALATRGCRHVMSAASVARSLRGACLPHFPAWLPDRLPRGHAAETPWSGSAREPTSACHQGPINPDRSAGVERRASHQRKRSEGRGESGGVRPRWLPFLAPAPLA